jgi:hypothetical protein
VPWRTPPTIATTCFSQYVTLCQWLPAPLLEVLNLSPVQKRNILLPLDAGNESTSASLQSRAQLNKRRWMGRKSNSAIKHDVRTRLTIPDTADGTCQQGDSCSISKLLVL